MTIQQIFDEFDKNRSNIEISIEQMKKFLKDYEEQIVLYGAGSAGIAFLHYLRDAEIQPVYFADGDKEKVGNICEGLLIISPEDIIRKIKGDPLVIITINTDGKHYCKDFKQALLAGGHEGVHEKLKEAGCRNVIDYTYFRKCFGIFSGGKYNLPACTDVDTMSSNRDQIQQVYDLLESQEARETFLSILKFRMVDDTVDIKTYPEEEMYFEYDLFPALPNEVFVDCGACGGSSLSGFLTKKRKTFEHYYGIEPDITNYNHLTNYVKGLDDSISHKMDCFHCGVYDKDGEEKFFVLHGPGTFAADIGTERVKTAKIDSILSGSRATYIKMNIEGSEVPALKGARNTIINYKPRMAIMGYHKTEDFWEVPLLMKQYRPDYKINLRSYMKNVAFAYYAY